MQITLFFFHWSVYQYFTASLQKNKHSEKQASLLNWRNKKKQLLDVRTLLCFADFVV